VVSSGTLKQSFNSGVSAVKTPKIAKGVVVEQVGADLLVVAPGSLKAVRLTGDAAQTLSKIQAGTFVDSTSHLVGELTSLGILDTPGVTRRGAITAGAIAAGAGISVMAMPGLAAASSDIVDDSPVDLEGIWYIQNDNGTFGMNPGFDIFVLRYFEATYSGFPVAEPPAIQNLSNLVALGSPDIPITSEGGRLYDPGAKTARWDYREKDVRPELGETFTFGAPVTGSFDTTRVFTATVTWGRTYNFTFRYSADRTSL
jgi:hypothetical protein